jgi:hypothetical protein
MVGVGGTTVKVALVAFVLVAGCFWRSYGQQALAHVDLLTAMAHKGADLVAGGRLTAETMPELTYPLERAQAFARAAAARSRGAPPPSLTAFAALVERYREFVDALDRVRREHTGDKAREALAEPLAAVAAAAQAVRMALRAEARV